MSLIGILTTDTDLVVTTWDPTLESMTGIPAARARGQRLDEIVPDLRSRVPFDLIREPLVSGSAQVLAPALHKYLIPCPPLRPSVEFEFMQQRVVVGALRDDSKAVGLVMSIEDVTERLEHERRLARQLREGSTAMRMSAIEQLGPLEPTEGLGPLGDAIADDDWRVRRAAVRALAARRDASLVDALVSALREGHRNFSLLSSALQLLTLTGVDFTAALIRLMQSPDADLRIQAALALGTQRRPEAVEALLAAFDDENPNVRFHAIESIGKLAPPAAIERLTQIAEGGDFYLAFPAIEALIRINDPVVATRLAPLLHDSVLGAAAADALGRIGDEDVVGALVDALGESEAPAANIVDALVQIRHRYETAFAGGEQIEDLVGRRMSQSGVRRILDVIARATGESLRAPVIVLGWLQDPLIPSALANLLGSAEARHDVIEAFVRCGPSAVTLLMTRLAGDDVETIRTAVVALGRIGDRRAVPPLLDVLEHTNRELRLAAASALARLGDPRAFEPLLGLLGDPDVAIRQAAIGALNSIGHPGMGPKICALLKSPDPLERESALKIAGYFGYDECTEQVVAACADPDERVRTSALEHLPYFEHPKALELLTNAMRSETPRARAAAAKALAAMPGSDAQALLAAGLSDPEPWVRYFSAISLGRQGSIFALDTLAHIASDDPAPHVQVAAIEAIGEIGGDRAVEILKPLAVAESDSGRAAITVLGRTQAPDVLDTLANALRSPTRDGRLAAVSALASWGGGDAVPSLQWSAAADSDPAVVRAALSGLATIASADTPAARPAVRALLAHLSDPARRADTLAVLGHLSPRAIPYLSEALIEDDPRVRRGVIEALGRLSHPSASACLQKALTDTDAIVRRDAIRALSRLGTRGLGRRFAALAETDPAPAVRQAATAALTRQVELQQGGE